MVAVSLALLVFLIDTGLLGLLTIGISICFAITTRSFLVLVLSGFNILLGIAFDYFLRVRPQGFEFYSGNGASVDVLCLLSLLTYMAIAMLDTPKGGSKRAVTIEARLPQFSRLMYYPCVLAILLCALFILRNEKNLLTSSFDIRELVKYPFLEYFGIIAFFAIGAAGQEKRKLLVAYSSVIFLIAVCLLTSYRMVAIVISMAVIFMRYRERTINKSVFAALWCGAYVLLMLISYVRLGMENVGFDSLVGYVDGRLDNTFTGVIETALIYTGISEHQDYAENFMHFLGTIAPLPSSFIPDSMQYIVHIHNVYPGKIPGGGILAGFFIYFNYLLVVPVSLFLFFALRRAKKKTIFGVMYFITFICVARWWLYGPFVFFKFFGVFWVIYFINFLALKYEGRLRQRRRIPSGVGL